jgi:hypothetical protein
MSNDLIIKHYGTPIPVPYDEGMEFLRKSFIKVRDELSDSDKTEFNELLSLPQQD